MDTLDPLPKLMGTVYSIGIVVPLLVAILIV